MRPGREALILRRLVERHQGRCPRAVIVRMWREIMIAVLLACRALFRSPSMRRKGRPGFWDLARDHFGSLTPATAHNSATAGAAALDGGPATVGVLPLPEADDPQPWWPMLLGHDAKRPRVDRAAALRRPARPCAAPRSRRWRSAASSAEPTGPRPHPAGRGGRRPRCRRSALAGTGQGRRLRHGVAPELAAGKRAASLAPPARGRWLS